MEKKITAVLLTVLMAGVASATSLNATQSQYMTWRTMSDNSDPGSWWHPGFEENPILDHVEEKAYEVLEEQIAAGLERDYAQIIEGK